MEYLLNARCVNRLHGLVDPEKWPTPCKGRVLLAETAGQWEPEGVEERVKEVGEKGRKGGGRGRRKRGRSNGKRKGKKYQLFIRKLF